MSVEGMLPSIEVAKKLAQMEYEERDPVEALRLQFEAINQLPAAEQSVVKEVLESLIIKYQTRRWDSARTSLPS